MNLIQLEKIALSNDEIEHAMGKIPYRFIEYPKLIAFHNLEQLLENIRVCVVLLEIDDDATKAGHWIAIIKRDGHFEYFDPYGLRPAQELAITHEKGHILGIIDRTNKKVVINTIKFQEFKNDVNTCGRWCIVRGRHWRLDLDDFKKFIYDNPLDMKPDIYVTYLTRSVTDDRNAWSQKTLDHSGGKLGNAHPLSILPTFSSLP